jgi:hypothetical protein
MRRRLLPTKTSEMKRVGDLGRILVGFEQIVHLLVEGVVIRAAARTPVVVTASSATDVTRCGRLQGERQLALERRLHWFLTGRQFAVSMSG